MTCINCETEHNHKFCPNCGEQAQTPAITFQSILSDATGTLSNMDRGFLFNLKNLFWAPKRVVNAYLKGKRKNIYNPISYLIIAVSAYLLVDVLVVVKSDSKAYDSEIYSIGVEAGRFMKTNLKYFWISTIIWLSLATWLIFRKYNYAKHLAINAFVLGQATLVSMTLFPLFKIPIVLDPAVYFLSFWILYQVFKEEGFDLESMVKSGIAVFLFFVQLFLLIILIGILKIWI